MKSSIIAVGALFLAAVAAQPHSRHAHRHADKHAKRELVIVTDYVDITETVLLTATVWVDGKGNTISQPVTGESKSTAQGKPVTRSHTYSPGIFNEPASTPTPKTTAPLESSPVETKPVETSPAETKPVESTPVEAKPLESTPVEAKPVEPSPVEYTPIETKPVDSTPSAPYVAPVVPTPQPEPQVEVAAAPAPAAPAPAAPAVGGPCSAGSPCTGDITFYQAGLGACGETHDGLAESVVALPHGMMGTQSNGNPFCGRTVSITKNGKTTSAVVVDKCMGCTDGDLDLSEKAFAALGIDQSVGRTTAEWYFTS